MHQSDNASKAAHPGFEAAVRSGEGAQALHRRHDAPPRAHGAALGGLPILHLVAADSRSERNDSLPG